MLQAMPITASSRGGLAQAYCSRLASCETLNIYVIHS